MNSWETKSLKKTVKPDANSGNVEEVNISPEKRKEILNELRKVI